MANKRMRKLIQNSRRRSRGEESSNRGAGDENESQDMTSNEGVNDQDENEDMPSSEVQQRRRGKTVMKDIHALDPGRLLVVKFNERGQPYGDLQPTLANFIGTIARNGNALPLNYLDWRKMSRKRFNDAWKEVIAHFDIPNRHRGVIMQMMGAAWRRWRTEVKATSYDSNMPLEELVQIQPIPHGLSLQTWETLCDYWKKTEDISKMNRENANKKKGTHAQGRTSIPSLEHKFFQENGRKPSRIEILHLSRRSSKKGGAPVDDEAIRVENELQDAVHRHLQDKPEGTQPIEVHEEAFRDVFGLEHSGRVRCLGAGALPSQVFPEQCKRNSIYRQECNPLAFTEEFRSMTEKIKEMETREAQRQTGMEQMRRQMQANQIQNFGQIMQSMRAGSAGGSRGPELLPSEMANAFANIIEQYINAQATAEENERGSFPPRERD